MTLIISMIINGGNLSAQEKYAVLICGDPPPDWPELVDSNSGWGAPGDSIQEEFWNDTFLMWEMLITNFNYDADNVYVLYYDGDDYRPDDQADRYNSALLPFYLRPITDMAATRTNVISLFEGFANGVNKLTQDDFLFVWTFGHGNYCGEVPPDWYPCVQLKDADFIWDFEFADLMDDIDTEKKVFWMQQCGGGAFADDLENVSSVFHSASLAGEPAAASDNYPDVENEVINNKVYQHAEFNFHVYSSTNGQTPFFTTTYDGQPLSDADLNSDNIISIYESWIWERDKESRDETPVYSDLGSIGQQTSLLYPTLLSTDIPAASNITHRGFIGISKDIHVPQGSQLTIHDNAVLHLVNEANLIVDQGATLIIGDNVTITGTNSNNELIVEGNITIGENVVFNSQNNVSWIFYFENSPESIILVASTIMGSDGRFVIGNEL